MRTPKSVEDDVLRMCPLRPSRSLMMGVFSDAASDADSGRAGTGGIFAKLLGSRRGVLEPEAAEGFFIDGELNFRISLTNLFPELTLPLPALRGVLPSEPPEGIGAKELGFCWTICALDKGDSYTICEMTGSDLELRYRTGQQTNLISMHKLSLDPPTTRGRAVISTSAIVYFRIRTEDAASG